MTNLSWNAIQAYRIFLEPLSTSGRLREAIRNNIRSRNLVADIVTIGRQNTTHFGFEQIVGESRRDQRNYLLPRRVAASEVSCVLLQGESGTGKDLIAKAIHHTSARSSKPFVTINCTAIPCKPAESELFGFEKGAFTDAKFRKEGLFEQAEGGTTFSGSRSGSRDGTAERNFSGCSKKEIFGRVGGLRDLPLNVRVIGASNRDLKTECEAKRFRLDLFLRVCHSDDLPPLRHRGEDVIRLAEDFIKTIRRPPGERSESGD